MNISASPALTAQFNPAQVQQGEYSRQKKSATKTDTELTEQEKAEVAKLKKRDQEVRQHERAHLSAAGQYAKGGASYQYQRGPDGVNYAIGGEVSIDTSAVAGDPEATIQKAEQLKRAANAPANPSSQDRNVAAQATAMAIKARIELSRKTGEAY